MPLSAPSSSGCSPDARGEGRAVYLVLAALAEELTELLSRASIEAVERWHGFTFHRGRLSGKEVVIARTGVGKSLSAMLAQHLIDRYRPQALLFSGIAGALRPQLEIGDMVVARDCLQYDLDARPAGFALGQVPFTDIRIIACDERLREIALSFQPAGYRITEGRILTGDLFLTRADRESHRYLVEELEGTAVEMEGASVGLVATINETPFLLVRVISDRADGAASVDFARFLPEASARTGALVAYLLARL